MAKQKGCQTFIYKISANKLKKNKWKLDLPLSDARENKEVVSLANEQVFRWLNEIDGITDVDTKVSEIRQEIKRLRRENNSLQNRKRIKELYENLDKLQFNPHIVMVEFENSKEYKRACKGFKINDTEYARLLGTTGGIKNSTILFIDRSYSDEIHRRIDNGRNKNIPLVPAKLEAYSSLTCSSTTPVSMPNGILVVKDCETDFYEDVISLKFLDTEEPEMEYLKNQKIALNDSDGYGLMLPSLAKRWSEELGLDYVVSGVNTRLSFEKGMVFTFDFIDFADKVAHNFIVKDAWGNDVDVRNVELILTTSQLKLWNSYNSIEHYLQCCKDNHYDFGITKTCPKTLEAERRLNYQFIQSYHLTDDQIKELCQPTIEHFRNILSDDWRKALLFACGKGLDENQVLKMDSNSFKGIMACPDLFNDVCIRKQIWSMLRVRKDDAKIGCLYVKGNYSILCGDPYSLCQSIFGLKVTGLLEAGQIYNKFWVDDGSQYVACFRAPMTCHNNIKKMEVVSNDESNYWYKYMTTCTIFNSWDSTAHALNGADKDGDMVFITNNKVLVDNVRNTPTIMCMQKNADKKIVTEDMRIESNIAGFGDDIGKITNHITSMFAIQSQFDKDSDEYKILDYRIMCGQLLQQDAIDKAKGIISKPMPKSWYDIKSARDKSKDGDNQSINIVACKKPYFMTYIYPAVMSEYKTYTSNASKKAYTLFLKDIDTLLHSDENTLTEDEIAFKKQYNANMPVGMQDCLMNKICWLIEDELDNYMSKNPIVDTFDYKSLKDDSITYSDRLKYQILGILNKYKADYKDVKNQFQSLTSKQAEAKSFALLSLYDNFEKDIVLACSNDAQIYSILVDNLSLSSSFDNNILWSICGDYMIDKLLIQNGGVFVFPARSDNGDIQFGGETFELKTIRVKKGNCNE